jgi:hypothetical protein
MAAQVLDRAPATERRTGAATVVAFLGAAAFVIAAAWYTLAVRGVTVASAPKFGPHFPLARAEHIYYRWLVTTLPQERFYTAIAIGGFLCLALVAAFARDWLGRDAIAAIIGSFLAAAGAAAWIAGSLLELGGHRAVGLMATNSNPIDTTNSISFTIDMTGQAFSLAAFALLAAGMLAFAWAAIEPGRRRRAWAAYTALIAVVMLVTAWSYAAGYGDLTDLLLLVGGVALLPGWLVWTGRTIAAHGRRAAPSADGSA